MSKELDNSEKGGGEELVQDAKDPKVSDDELNEKAQEVAKKGVDHHAEFNPTKHLPDNFFMLMYGMRRCGKSTTLNFMLYSMRNRLKYYKVYLFSSTAKVDPDQYTWAPKEHQFHDLEMLDEELGRIIEEQEELVDVKDKKEREKARERNRVLIVMDDCVNESTVRNSKNLNGLAVHGRHLGVSVIILSQCVAGSGSVPPIVRTQADAIMMCTLPRSTRERDLIHEQYLSADDNNKNKEKSRALMENVTSVQYRNMVVGMWDTSVRRTRDFVFTFGPVDPDAVPEGFQLGHPSQWEEEDSESDGGDGESVSDISEGGGDQHQNEDDNEDEGDNTKRAEAVHGGGLKNLGIQAAANDLKQLLMKELSDQATNDTTNYLPPAFAAGKNGNAFRSFVQYSMSGARETVPQDSYKYEVDGIWEETEESNRLQGQRFDKPEKEGKKKKRLAQHKKKRTSTYNSILKRPTKRARNGRDMEKS